MKMLVLTFMLSTLFSHFICSEPVLKTKEKTRSIKLELLIPLLSEQRISGYDTTTQFFYYANNITFFKTAYQFDSSPNNLLIKSEKRYNYLVYENNQKYGVFYNMSDSSISTKTHVDSFLRFKAFGSIQLDSLVARKELKQQQDNFSKEKGEAFRVYTVQSKFDSKRNDSIKLTFSNKLNWVDFSFSKRMDKLFEMKLCRIEFSIVSPTDKDHLSNLVDAKMVIEMSDATHLVDPTELNNYLNRYLMDKKKFLGNLHK